MEFQLTVPVGDFVGVAGANGVQGSEALLNTPVVPMGVTFFLFDATLIADPTGNITIDPFNSANIRIRDGGVYEFSYYVAFQCTPNVPIGQIQ